MGISTSSWSGGVGVDSGLPQNVAYPAPANLPVGTSVGISTANVPNPITDPHSLALQAGSGKTVTVDTAPFLLPANLLGGLLVADVPYATTDASGSGAATAKLVLYDKLGIEQRSVTIWTRTLQEMWIDTFPWLTFGTQGTECAIGFRYQWAGNAPSGGTAYFMPPRVGLPGGDGKSWDPVWNKWA